jgi:hypothetical protein
MISNDSLLSAIYRARETKLKQLSDENGALGENETQEEPTITPADIKPILELDTEALNRIPTQYPFLVEKGWLVPASSKSTEGTYAWVKMTSRGIDQARRLASE